MSNAPLSDDMDLQSVIRPTGAQIVARYIMNILMIAIFILLCVYVIWWIVVLWPESRNNDAKYILPLLKWKIKMILSLEQQYLVIVALGGVLGAFVHISTSFVDFLGSKKLSYSWIPWYLMRPFIGGALAVIFYLLLRGGLINGVASQSNSESEFKLDSLIATLNSNGTPVSPKDSLRVALVKALEKQKKETSVTEGKSTGSPIPLNPYGIMALACMAGMFSKQATDKLREVFDSLFRMKAGNETGRADPLNGSGKTRPTLVEANLTSSPQNDDVAAG